MSYASDPNEVYSYSIAQLVMSQGLIPKAINKQHNGGSLVFQCPMTV